jgi:hypothetical protein
MTIQEADLHSHRSINGSIKESNGESLPFWQVNVPPDKRTLKCPDFLQRVSQKDIEILSTPDKDYHILTWPKVCDVIAHNRLDLFQRVPSDLRRYLAYNWEIKQEYGSVMQFILSQRLHWDPPVTPKGRPFEYEEDWLIRWNDWPYGIDERIVHLVVWTKFNLEEDPVTTDLTDEARKEIDDFVKKIFCKRMKEENVSVWTEATESKLLTCLEVIWFKNWSSLKSIHAVEHFHVMLFDPDMAFVDEVTNGDVPLCKKV